MAKAGVTSAIEAQESAQSKADDAEARAIDFQAKAEAAKKEAEKALEQATLAQQLADETITLNELLAETRKEAFKEAAAEQQKLVDEIQVLKQ